MIFERSVRRVLRRPPLSFTSRITPARQRLAAEFGAELLSSPSQLLKRLQSVAEARPTARGPVLGTVLLGHHRDDLSFAERLQRDLRRMVVGNVELEAEPQRALKYLTDTALIQIVGPAFAAAILNPEQCASLDPLPQSPDAPVNIVLALVGDGVSPDVSVFPPSLSSRPVVELRDPHWDDDVARLVELLKQMRLSAVPGFA